MTVRFSPAPKLSARLYIHTPPWIHVQGMTVHNDDICILSFSSDRPVADVICLLMVRLRAVFSSGLPVGYDIDNLRCSMELYGWSVSRQFYPASAAPWRIIGRFSAHLSRESAWSHSYCRIFLLR